MLWVVRSSPNKQPGRGVSGPNSNRGRLGAPQKIDCTAVPADNVASVAKSLEPKGIIPPNCRVEPSALGHFQINDKQRLRTQDGCSAHLQQLANVNVRLAFTLEVK